MLYWRLSKVNSKVYSRPRIKLNGLREMKHVGKDTKRAKKVQWWPWDKLTDRIMFIIRFQFNPEEEKTFYFIVETLVLRESFFSRVELELDWVVFSCNETEPMMHKHYVNGFGNCNNSCSNHTNLPVKKKLVRSWASKSFPFEEKDKSLWKYSKLQLHLSINWSLESGKFA